MKTYADKTKESKSQSMANAFFQKRAGGQSAFQFVDNRPEALSQRKLQEMADNYTSQQHPIEKEENKTGLPDNLKSGIENLSGYSMDDVKVYYNSSKPAQLQAHAYAQGTDIHLASGQEKHLPHEVWHVVQQKQGRAKPTMQLKGGVNVNDDVALEKEADAMGIKAMQGNTPKAGPLNKNPANASTQLIKIGKDKVVSANQLAQKLRISRELLLTKLNTAMGNVPDFDAGSLNTFLAAKKSKVHGGLLHDADQYIGKLAQSLTKYYFQYGHPDFLERVQGMEENDDFTTLMDSEGINYGAGVDDGAGVGDGYNASLACTLFALLRLKPGFLGAASPIELHHVLRLNTATQNYDDEPVVAKIRLAAGLTYHTPAEGQTNVSGFMGNLDESDRGTKYIIDPAGEAHTWVLEYEGHAWRKYDNDNQDGTQPSNDDIKVYWTA